MYADVQIKREIYNTEEHQMMRTAFTDFAEKEMIPNREQWEDNQQVGKEVWLRAGELGFLCIDMPEEYGGLGLDFSYSAQILELMMRYECSGPGFSLHSDIAAPYIKKYGSEDQKQIYLRKMALGEWIASLAMTEPGTGSDVQSIRTTAEDKGAYYLLNGSKTFITNGYMSDFAIVACKTNPDAGHKGVSLLLVHSDLNGFTKGKPFKKLGLKAQDTCELFFDNVEVPKENLLGDEGMGFIYMMSELPRERHTIALQSIGGAELALEETIKYTSDRRAFGKSISDFQNTQFKLAELATQLQIHTAFADKCTELIVQGQLTPVQASMAKMACSEMHNKLVDECLQLHGGYGFMWEYMIARNFADARVSRIYGGTNEIMKLLISRGLLKDYFSSMRREENESGQKKAMMTEA